MKKIYLILVILSALNGFSQSLPIDFEGDVTTADFADFGGGIGIVTSNPSPTGINTSSSVARIIRDGGAVVLDYSDILSWFNWPDISKPLSKSSPIIQQMTIQEHSVIKILELGETQFDEMLSNLDYSAPQLTAILVTMEIKGIIDRLPGNKYAIKGR